MTSPSPGYGKLDTYLVRLTREKPGHDGDDPSDSDLGFLAGPRLYHAACSDRGVRVVHPDRAARSTVDVAISAVKAGSWGDNDVRSLLAVIAVVRRAMRYCPSS
ncbi:hypothetical protein Atai01_62950 [Amycolatopsis taiwanensis]|uniref:Uncharacterized protein n=1 Tax=Amycolatopsis taiwanensis TaxID=342230 RepID=A0A9W6R627_9PSEU|nr:hypothetical protein Atai01_62950 [Amycolatopsis taiwanensis]